MKAEKASNVSPIRRLVAPDRTVHEPARLAVLLLLSVVEKADFLYILDESGMSKGNLSSHMARLEEAGSTAAETAFLEKLPRTVYELTDEGRAALDAHREILLEALQENP